MILLIIGLLMFVGLVVVHEYGHFIMARRNGVEVEEFGIGFPPRAWVKRIRSKKGEYDFTLNWLPLGGFVKLKGENDADTAKGSFGAATLPAKVKIMGAGVVMNLVTAFILLTLLALVGIPKLIPNQFTVGSDNKIVKQDILISFVEEGSPAEKAGLRTQDQLASIAGEEVTSEDGFRALTKKHAGEQVPVVYQRAGQQQTATVALRSEQEVAASRQTDHPKGYVGIVPGELVVQRATWSAPVVGAGLIRQFTAETFKGLGRALSSLFKGEGSKASEQVAGPVGIFFVMKNGSLLGYQFILLIVAIISLTLAIMNILPIPALDGGRLFVTLLFRAVRKPLSKRTEDLIHGTGFAFLMVLFVVITCVDVGRFF